MLNKPALNNYVDISWRLEVQIASRYLNRQCLPLVTLTLELKRDDDKKEILMQTDVNNLCKIINVLEKALQEGKSQRVHNITHALT